MAIKAKDSIVSKKFSTLGLALIFVFVIGYTVIYNQYLENMADGRLKSVIGTVTLVIMVGFFFFNLKYMTTRYNFLLTHEFLAVDRVMFGKSKRMEKIAVSSMMRIQPEETALRQKKKARNYFIARVEDKAVYILVYEHQSAEKIMKIQCSEKFYEAIKLEIELGKKKNKKSHIKGKKK